MQASTSSAQFVLRHGTTARAPSAILFSVLSNSSSSSTYYASQLPSSRPFSTTQRSSGVMPNSRESAAARKQMARVPATQGTKAQMKKQQLDELVPLDVGVLPGTFIRPVASNMPSLFTSPKDRLKLEWSGVNAFFYGVMSLLITKFYAGKEQKITLDLRDRRPQAVALHSRMYKAFARGDVKLLKEVTCEGLFRDFSKQVSARQGGRLEWVLLSHKKDGPFGLPIGVGRTLSDRAVQVPIVGNTVIIRQAVVRISSEQRLDRVERVVINKKDRLQKTSGTPQSLTENVVMQKVYMQGRESPWKVWGTADATTLADLEKPEWQMQDGLWSRVKNMWANRT